MAAKIAKQPTDRITVRLPRSMIEQITAMVNANLYRNTTDVVYNAMKLLVVSKGGEAKATIEAQKGMLELQQMMAKIEKSKRELGLS